MYNVRRLSRIAGQGLADLLPAMRQAFNADVSDDQLDQVYGESPRAMILGLSLLGVTIGEWFARSGPVFELKDFVNWPAVIIGSMFATLIRRYLFYGSRAQAEDFPWLAASMVPATVLVGVVSLVSGIVTEMSGNNTFWELPGALLVAVADALGVAAALTIAVATLCYSRNWLRALWDLAVRLLVFRLMVWVTVLIMLEIGIVGQIVSGILAAVFGWHLPRWLVDLADQVSYAGLMSVIYLAVIGATWAVCRKRFGELLEKQEVDILRAIATMAKGPKDTGPNERSG